MVLHAGIENLSNTPGLVAQWKYRGDSCVRPSWFPHREAARHELQESLRYLGIKPYRLAILLGLPRERLSVWLRAKDGSQPSPVYIWRISALVRMKAQGRLDIQHKALLVSGPSACELVIDGGLMPCLLDSVRRLKADDPGHPWIQFALPDGHIPHRHLPQVWEGQQNGTRQD